MALGLIYFVWLPRIVRQRHERELATDPAAFVRLRRRRRWAIVGYLAGTAMGGLGLALGLGLGG